MSFGHSHGYFDSFQSQNISFARPPLASAQRVPDARFESHILSLAQTKTTLFRLLLVLAEDVRFELTGPVRARRFSKPLV